MVLRITKKGEMAGNQFWGYSVSILQDNQAIILMPGLVFVDKIASTRH